MISEKASELIKQLHKELNATGKCNTYIFTEDLGKGGFVYLNVRTAEENITEAEKKSFCELLNNVAPYIRKRTADFKGL